MTQLPDIRILGCGRVPTELQVVSRSALLPADVTVRACAIDQCVKYLPSGAARRYSRLQKMGVAAARCALDDSPLKPQNRQRVAISAGSGLGPLAETTEFIDNIFRLEEAQPKPAKFVTSVHNAVASQMAIAYGFSGENFTFTHQAISFELALWQAMHLLRNDRAEYVLVCGVDELSPHLLSTAFRYRWSRSNARPNPVAVSDILSGEGGAAFLISRNDSPEAAKGIRILGLQVSPLNSKNSARFDLLREAEFMCTFLDDHGVRAEDIDLILTGSNGAEDEDAVYLQVMKAFDGQAGTLPPYQAYKQFCGEFYTASAVALATAVEMLRIGRVLPALPAADERMADRRVSRILLYHLGRTGHSLCLVVS